MNTKRITGGADIPLIECINHYIGKYRIRYDIKESTEEEFKKLQDQEIETPKQVTFFETDILLSFKPRLYDIRQAILNDINARTDNTILSGFVWNGMNIWLSSENQFNYKAAFDLAIQTEGASLPVVFKFGTTENPVYHEFKDIPDITDFYIKAMAHINKSLEEGWKLKDNIDWSLYEEALNN